MITYPGEVVSRMQPLVAIRSHSLDYVDAYFSLSHVNQLFLGQKATITLTGDKVHRLKAVVTDIGLQNQRASSTEGSSFTVFKGALPEEYLVVLRIVAVPDNMKSIFKPGVPVTVAMD